MNYETPVIGESILDVDEEQQRPSKRRALAIAAILAILIAGIATWAWMRPRTPAPVDDAAQEPVITVISPGRSMVEQKVSATGSLAARVEMPVGVAGEGGQVRQVLVQPGDWVRSGHILAVIERSVQTEQIRSLAAQVEVNRADAKLAQAQLDRARALVGRGFISRADIDQRTATRDGANARVNVAVAQLAEQRARTERLDIRAPAAGLILTRAVEPGQIVASGSATLFRIARGGEMEMLAQVSEADLATLRPGNRATVTPVGGAISVVGRLWQVAPVIDQQNRQGIARIAIAYDRAIRPGGFASAIIVSGSGMAPTLPESAVLSDAKGNYVYIVDRRDRIERRAVTTGQVSDSGVSIVRGLDGSERIVRSAGAFLNIGQKVKPQAQARR